MESITIALLVAAWFVIAFLVFLPAWWFIEK